MAPRESIGRFVDVDLPAYRGAVHLREDGPDGAPVLVLIHGFSGSMRWFDLIVPMLTDSFRIVRVDLAGHGSTGGRAADAPVQAQIMAAVLAELAVTDATVLGHSFGADVAVDLAEHSHRVARLVILAQAPDYSDATLPRAGVLVTTRVLGTVVARAARLAAMTVGAVAAVSRRHPTGVDLAAQAIADFAALDGRMFRIVLVDRRSRMAARPLDVQLEDAGKPALVILGERDHFYGARSAERYRDAGAEVQILPDSGHSPHVELPEQTAVLIRAFASRVAHEN